MIFIRVDANERIGTGHVMRCLSIASQIKKLDEAVSFVIADESSKKMIEEQGYSTVCLNSQWDDLDQEIEDICRLVEVSSVNKILVDSYFVTEKYLNVLRTKAKVFYIDDLNLMPYPVDVLINYNIYGPGQNYSGTDGKLLLGTMYTPLRKEFHGIGRRKFQGIRKILITSGGTDRYGMIIKILTKLLSVKAYQEIEYYCILGRFHVDTVSLHEKFGGWQNVRLLQNVNNMDFYMKECDIAITAGGTTIYELCACGIPSVLYTIADNQLGIAHAFSEKGIIPWAGDVRDDEKTCLDNIVREITQLNDADCWEQRSKTMQSLVDGNGALRIAQEMVK